MRKLLLLAMIASLAIVAACSEETTGPTDNTGLYTISGKLRFDSARAIPANAHVYALFNVSSGSPDYLYVFGRGTVNMADSTFKLTFTQTPPAEALNSYGLGVGAITIFTTDLADGKIPQESLDTLEDYNIGLAEDYAVIYLSKSPDSVALGRQWAKNFQTGFNTGKGVRKDQGFDEFEPTQPNLIEIVIDAFRNLEWVNWT
jgi:hypothetical protein